jgi:hypothetical protein
MTYQMPQSRSSSSLLRFVFRSLDFSGESREDDEERHVRAQRVGTLVCAANPDLDHESAGACSSSSARRTDSGVSAPRFRLPISYSGVSAMLSRGG